MSSNGTLNECEIAVPPPSQPRMPVDDSEPAENDGDEETTAEPKEDDEDAEEDADDTNNQDSGTSEGVVGDADEADDSKKSQDSDTDLFGLGSFLSEGPSAGGIGLDNDAKAALIACDPADKLECQNEGSCMKNATGHRICICDRNGGFIGRYCQFCM